MSAPSTAGTTTDVWARVRPIVLRTIIGAVVAAGLVGVVAVLVGDFGTVALQLLLTILVVVVFALLSWYDADVSAKRSSVFALVSVVTSLYLLVAGFCKIWIVSDPGPQPFSGADSSWSIGAQFWQWIGLVLIARAALLHVHLLLIIHRRYPTPVLQVVAKVTVGLIALLAVLVSIPVLFSHTHFGEPFWRLLWVVAILDLLGTVIVPLSNALFRPRRDRTAGSGASDVHGGQDELDRYGMTASLIPLPAVPTGFGAFAGPGGPGGPGGLGGPTGVASVAGVGWAEVPSPHATAPDSVTTAEPHAAGHRYEPRPAPDRRLAWPRYVDGTPLPAHQDGTPDFGDVEHT